MNNGHAKNPPPRAAGGASLRKGKPGDATTRRWTRPSAGGAPNAHNILHGRPRGRASRDGETIWRVAAPPASRFRICAIRRSRAIAPTAIAAPAWSRSKASACWPQAASAQPARRHEGQRLQSTAQRPRGRWCSIFWYPISRRAKPRTIPISKFWNWADKMGVETGRFPEREEAPAPDRSHPAMAVNLDACIQCNLCVRACREVQVNDVIGMAGRGHNEKIVFDFDDPMGNSTCVACGECVQACPTGALMPAIARQRTTMSAPNIPTSRSIRFALIAASAASSPTTSRTTSSLCCRRQERSGE